jgi:hypothetical protein
LIFASSSPSILHQLRLFSNSEWSLIGVCAAYQVVGSVRKQSSNPSPYLKPPRQRTSRTRVKHQHLLFCSSRCTDPDRSPSRCGHRTFGLRRPLETSALVVQCSSSNLCGVSLRLLFGFRNEDSPSHRITSPFIPSTSHSYNQFYRSRCNMKYRGTKASYSRQEQPIQKLIAGDPPRYSQLTNGTNPR